MKTMPKPSRSNGNSRQFTTQASLDSYVWSICDILRRSNCAGALQYIPGLLKSQLAAINRLPTSFLRRRLQVKCKCSKEKPSG